MKTKATRKFMKTYYRTFSAGYCDLQYIMNGQNAHYYNAGVYGWNWDAYTNGMLAVTTGYRNMVGTMIPAEIIEKYSSVAKALLEDWTIDYCKRLEMLENNRFDFWRAVADL